MRIALIGDGKMSRAVASLAPERGHEVSAVLDAAANRGGEGISRRALGEPDVAVEFTEPSSALPNVMACLEHGIPIVVGTTGWYQQLPLVVAAAIERGGALVWAPNFALGVNIFLEVVRRAAPLLAFDGYFDAHVLETHHAAKKDAPSGTAKAIVQAAASETWRTLPVTSVRVGAAPGTHEVICDAPFEQVRLVHEARDRRVFADGALRAAEWLHATWRAGRRGIFTMRDVLQLTEEVPR